MYKLYELKRSTKGVASSVLIETGTRSELMPLMYSLPTPSRPHALYNANGKLIFQTFRGRKHLHSTEELSPLAKRVKEVNQRFKNHPLPRFLDYKRWTKKDWKREEEIWEELDKEMREKQRQSARDEKKWYTKGKRIRHHKVLRDLRKSERRERLDQRHGKKIRKSITQSAHSELILAALKGGATTVGQVCKKTGLATRDARRCLRTLVQNGDVEKPGSRQYQLTKPKQRKRLADVQPTKRRKRLTKKSKVR